jgi:hypothetical protein
VQSVSPDITVHWPGKYLLIVSLTMLLWFLSLPGAIHRGLISTQGRTAVLAATFVFRIQRCHRDI